MSILDTLIAEFKGLCDHFTDLRGQSPNLKYSIVDIALAAFSVFFTQSPSFLDFQKQLERRHGSSNAQTLFGIEKIPTDNQIRNVLDHTAANTLFPSRAIRILFQVFEN
jgi:hypothetical protein